MSDGGVPTDGGERNDSREPRSEEEIRDWLVAHVSERLGVEAEEIDVREPFTTYGLSSREAVVISGDLEQWLGQQLSATLLYEHPSIEATAAYLSGGPETAAEPATAGAAVGRRPTVTDEPIAVIGIGCRFPGADGPEAYWKLLRDGVDAVTEVPADRFDIDAFYHPDPEVPGKVSTRWGGFLDGVDLFDPRFFGISPLEAERMDPQQRILLQVAWEALEDAGLPADELAGTAAGVFIGISTADYSRLQLAHPSLIDAYAGTGNAFSIAANRLSYLLDLQGPSVAIDTACSSSLVAVHLACSSLRSGESTLALAGGVNLILSPAVTINFSKAGAMAADGRCKSFDSRADGYVRSEGAGIVVLKPLSRAEADGDPIHALIRGSAVNQDGRTNGLMAPSRESQENVLRRAYEASGIAPAEVQYVEAHGTGTLLGDPIEAGALGTVLGDGRPSERPCAIGSVKSNIGHTEAAAGVAGLIKIILALQHRQIPPSLHFRQPNPHIPFDRLPLAVQTDLGPWPESSGPSVAGVSSFGFGGTNAHVVLERAADAGGQQQGEDPWQAALYLLPLSAKSPQALRRLAGAWVDLLRDEAAPPLADLCYSAAVRRTHHDHRLALVGGSEEELAEQLEAYLAGESRPDMSTGRRVSGRKRKVVFVFPGQGGQWLGMARGLMREETAFRQALERCDLAMRASVDWSLLDELASGERFDEIDVVQPAIFAVQVALAALWRSWGVRPDAVVGTSMGEAAAAHVAGALSLEDAARVICRRSRLLRRCRGHGEMAVVELGAEEAKQALGEEADRVSVAASNSPTSTVLSGEPQALAAILERLEKREVFCRRVKVDVASHSPQMDELKDELFAELAELRPVPPAVPFYSTVTGEVLGGSIGPPSGGPQSGTTTNAGLLDPDYWQRNLRQPVLFAGRVERLLADGCDLFVELSPHPVLSGAIAQCFHHAGLEGQALAAMRRDEDDSAAMLGAFGGLYTAGFAVDWRRIYRRGQAVRLPSYPWQKERFWLDVGGGPFAAEAPAGGHPLLGRHLDLAGGGGEHVFELALQPRLLPYLDDHRVQDAVVLPGTAYVEMGRAAAAHTLGGEPSRLTGIEFHKALFLPEGSAPTLQVVVTPGSDGEAAFAVYARPPGDRRAWTLHATGTAHRRPADLEPPPDGELEQLRRRCRQEVASGDFYRRHHERGNHWGPAFQSIETLWLGDREALGRLRVPAAVAPEVTAYRFHPAVLDACGQVLAAVSADEPSTGGQPFVLAGVERVHSYGPPGLTLWSHARLGDIVGNVAEGDVRVFDDAGNLVLELLGIRLRYLTDDPGTAVAESLDRAFYELRWEPAPRDPKTPEQAATWLIFADHSNGPHRSVGDALARIAPAAGERCLVVTPGSGFERRDKDRFRLDPASAEDMARLVEALPQDGPTLNVVHLWSLDAVDAAATTPETLETALTRGSASVVHLARELARGAGGRGDGGGRPEAPRLWLVTRGAQAVGEVSHGGVAVAQAPLWGLGRTLRQEHAAFGGALVDLDPEASAAASAGELHAEIRRSDGEDQLAFRAGRGSPARHVARLARLGPAEPPPTGDGGGPLALRPDATYLITGGLGDLGLLVARWLVRRGARWLVLMGRTGLPPRREWSRPDHDPRTAARIAAVRELEAAGAGVHLATIDVADEARLVGFLDGFRAEGWPQIRGVIHAAGVVELRTLTELDDATLRSVMRPKVTGGWLLHRHLEGPLDFFVLFSSATALLGSPRLGHYAAANAFLDALAHHRRSLGLPALAVDWALWGEIGMAARELSAGQILIQGADAFSPAEGLEALERLLRRGATQAAVMRVDWQAWQRQYPEFLASPLLTHLAREASEAGLPTDAGPQQQSLRDELLAADPGERRHLLEQRLRDKVAAVVGASAADLDVDVQLSELGVDSLMAVQLKNWIEVAVGVDMPLTRFLQGPSVAEISAQLLELLAEAPPPAAPDAAAMSGEDAAAALEAVDQLDDGEVDSMLAQLLAEEGATASEGSGEDAAEILEKVDQLDDGEVDSMLAEVLAEES